jgi:flavodoxin
MNALVVYDTQFGNTQKIAEAVAETVGAKAIRVADFKPDMLAGVSLLIVGSPILGWRPSEPTTAFLGSLPAGSLKGVRVAAFDTRVKMFISGSASDKMEKSLVDLGGTSAANPGKFYVKGKQGPLLKDELEKARIWAKNIRAAL